MPYTHTCHFVMEECLQFFFPYLCTCGISFAICVLFLWLERIFVQIGRTQMACRTPFFRNKPENVLSHCNPLQCSGAMHTLSDKVTLSPLASSHPETQFLSLNQRRQSFKEKLVFLFSSKLSWNKPESILQTLVSQILIFKWQVIRTVGSSFRYHNFWSMDSLLLVISHGRYSFKYLSVLLTVIVETSLETQKLQFFFFFPDWTFNMSSSVNRGYISILLVCKHYEMIN